LGKRRKRQRRLDTAVASIQRRHGPQSLFNGRLPASGSVPHVSSGFPALDDALGGGLPNVNQAIARAVDRIFAIDDPQRLSDAAVAAATAQLLAQAKQVAEELLADAQAAAKAKKTAPKTPKAPKIRVRGPVGDDLNELVSVVSEGREAIRDLFDAARDAEIGYLIRKLEEDDEEDAITALLMN